MANTIASSSLHLSRGSLNLAFKFPIKMIATSYGTATNSCSMQCNLGTSFGITYAPKTYHLRAPDVTSKLATFGPKFTVLSNCHHASYCHTTANPPLCLLSNSVSHIA